MVSVYVTGRELERLPAPGGQFCIWRFPDHHGWWQVNPFSLSAAPDGRSLRLTAKAVGTTSAGLRRLPVGSRAFVEGPYGAFTALHQMTDGLLLVAASGSRRSGRCSRSRPDRRSWSTGWGRRHAVLLSELQGLARARGAQLQLLAGRTGSGHPPLARSGPPSSARWCRTLPGAMCSSADRRR